MSTPKLDDLPPLARATAMAMERPYRPGQKRRVLLIGLVLVSAIAVAFLLRMPESKPRKVVAAPAATTGVVYQNLRAPQQALPARQPSPPVENASP